MISHKLIDFIRTDPHGYIPRIRSAIKFDLGHQDNFAKAPIGVSLNGFGRDGLLKIPYPVCFFEFEFRNFGHVGLLAEVHGDDIYFVSFYFNNNDVACHARFILSPKTMGVRQTEIGDAPGFIEVSDIAESGIIAILYYPLFFSLMLNCSNVIQVENKPSIKLNKKRIKAGKCPFFTYRTLHIGQDKRSEKARTLGESHAGPRIHLRRGHIRRISPQKMIWVNHCVVGDKRIGLVVKGYKVTRLNDETY